VELEGLKSRLDDDKTAREVVALALLLIQAERLGVNETTLRYFGAVISGAIGGDGSVSAAEGKVVLASGKREIALLWGAVLAAHGIKAKVRNGRGFDVVASGVGAARLAGLYFLFGPPLLKEDERVINHKLAEAVRLGAEGLDIRWEGLRRTEGGLVAADLIISVGGATVKYNVYLRENTIELEFNSTNRSRVELAARLLRLAGVRAEVKKESGGDVWYVYAYTNKLAAGREELRKSLAEIVEKARGKGWVDASKAEGWLEKLERGLTLEEGWPMYSIQPTRGGLMVRFSSTNRNSIEQVARQLREMGLEEGKHFSVKMSDGGRKGYVSILRKGLERAAWLSVRGEGERQGLAAKFVEYILRRAEEAGEEVCEKVREIIEEGKARGSLTLKGFEKEVEVDGRKYMVKVVGWSTELKESQSGKLLLKIKIVAEIDGVKSEYTTTYGRYGEDNEVKGRAYGRRADAERDSALIKALTGREPRIIEKNDGTIEAVCGRAHLKGFMRYAELADAIKEWLEETGRR